jgi:hypothetical protein
MMEDPTDSNNMEDIEVTTLSVHPSLILGSLGESVAELSEIWERTGEIQQSR